MSVDKRPDTFQKTHLKPRSGLAQSPGKRDGTLKMETPVQYLKGVGPHLAQIFENRGVYTVGDLLQFYPRTYEDRRAGRTISTLRPGELVSLRARILSVRSIPMGRSQRRIFDVALKDATGTIHAKYFRVPFKGYFDRFQPHTEVRVVGKPTLYRGILEFHHPDLRDIDDENENASHDQLIPIYTESEGVTGRRFAQIVQSAIQKVGEIPDAFPDYFVKENNLVTKADAVRSLHQPPQNSGPEFAEMKSIFHRRLIFEEFFWLELFLAMRKVGVIREKTLPVEIKLEQMKVLEQSLPFSLTSAQKKVRDEILSDLKRDYPMHRLVQGDVGSGKTIVALLASVVVAQNGLQTALMVPTEILAEQHFQTAKRFLEPLGIRVALLTGHMTASERKTVIAGLKTGDIKLCVGTHAIIQPDVDFKHLSFVIVDEQHRFGVQQRKILKEKGLSPHFLVMTATPIPRTLAMTVYGDLDVSVIDELPPGRSPIVTRVVSESKRSQVFGFLKEQIAKGRQAYIVFPLIDESEKMDLKNAMEEFEKLKKMMPEISFGLLHGRMKSEEKDTIMNQFREGKIQALVSTTVIEVGVDVPNANLMIVEHAERFGLSQLHQLRGRVGRGTHKSYCVLITGYAVSEESRARTQIMAETNDGFKIAEADLEIRGPGEFLGVRQSGLTGFKLAHLVRDVAILQEARDAAFKMIHADPDLKKAEHQLIKSELLKLQGPKAFGTIG